MANYSLDKLKILVVENHPQMRRMLVGILSAFGAGEVIGVKSGEKALAELGEGKYDLIFITSLEGGISGIDLIRKIRHEGYGTTSTLPIIMVSGRATPEYVIASRDAGSDEFLAKPYTGNLLYTHIKAVIERRRPFVSGGDFFGPERRRRNITSEGKDRRSIKHIYPENNERMHNPEIEVLHENDEQ